MAKTIPYGRQWIDKKDISSVIAALKSDFLTQGPRVEEFEKLFAKFVGAKYAVAVNNGTSALLAACFAAGITNGDEVITTPYTFSASVNCFVWFGAKPVFVDIKNNSFNIDETKIEGTISKKTKALLVVDFAGVPCDYDQIKKIAKTHNVIIIADAAHSLGSTYKGKKIGSIADLTCFSFHPVKTITTGEGGMITTNKFKYYQKLKTFRTHGIVKDPKNTARGKWYYEMVELGLNLRLTDIQAALGISQLNKISGFTRRRREIVDAYNKHFSDLPVSFTKEPSFIKSTWHLYQVRLAKNLLRVSRKEVFDQLQKRGLGVQVHYVPVHLHPYYKKMFGFKRGDFPNAEKAYEEEISLPLFPKMSNHDVNFVIKTFRDVIRKYQK